MFLCWGCERLNKGLLLMTTRNPTNKGLVAAWSPAASLQYKYWVPYPQFEWMNGFDEVEELSLSHRWPECAQGSKREVH
eukprot:7687090-Pyramimonas_sp.AAC.1